MTEFPFHRKDWRRVPYQTVPNGSFFAQTTSVGETDSMKRTNGPGTWYGKIVPGTGATTTKITVRFLQVQVPVPYQVRTVRLKFSSTILKCTWLTPDFDGYLNGQRCYCVRLHSTRRAFSEKL